MHQDKSERELRESLVHRGAFFSDRFRFTDLLTAREPRFWLLAYVDRFWGEFLLPVGMLLDNGSFHAATTIILAASEHLSQFVYAKGRKLERFLCESLRIEEGKVLCKTYRNSLVHEGVTRDGYTSARWGATDVFLPGTEHTVLNVEALYTKLCKHFAKEFVPQRLENADEAREFASTLERLFSDDLELASEISAHRSNLEIGVDTLLLARSLHTRYPSVHLAPLFSFDDIVCRSATKYARSLILPEEPELDRTSADARGSTELLARALTELARADEGAWKAREMLTHLPRRLPG